MKSYKMHVHTGLLFNIHSEASRMDPVNDKAVVQISYKHHTHVLQAAKGALGQIICGSDHSGSQALTNRSHHRQTLRLPSSCAP